MTDENTAPETEAAPKVERIKQNGVTRPADGTKTGAVWARADDLSTEHQRPALMAELVESLGPEFNRATVATQYNLWCTFYGITSEQRKAIRNEGKEEEKAEKAAAKAEAKALKDAEKAEAKALKDAAKAEAKAAAEAAAES